MKKILLIEANVAAGQELLDAAARLGIEAYVATHEELYEQYGTELREAISGTVFTDFSRPERALADLTEFCRGNGIDGVVTSWEFLTPLAIRLAAELGLPGHDVDLADACRNKRLMSEVLAAHGVPAPRTVSAPDHTRLAALIAEAGFTCRSSSSPRRTRDRSASPSSTPLRSSPRPPCSHRSRRTSSRTA
ncbi:hypothetical protein [Streptomyces sp. URMC 123]|uniref:hypothetical protein n=1 Tax=Streptomyces sp. URMC 123 TaxID=3423403 RepID=UPI003F1DEAEF